MLQLDNMLMAPFVHLQPLYHSDIQQRGLCVMTGSLSFLPLLSWAIREIVQAAAAPAPLSDCHSSIPLPLSAHGVQLTARDPLSQTASSSTREPSASADIFQSPFQQMEVLQVPFGVKYLASGYSIWSITNWIMSPPPTSDLQPLAPHPLFPVSSIMQ